MKKINFTKKTILSIYLSVFSILCIYYSLLLGWTFVILDEHKAGNLSENNWTELDKNSNFGYFVGVDGPDTDWWIEDQCISTVNNLMNYSYNGVNSRNPNTIYSIKKGHCGNYSELYAALYNRAYKQYGYKNHEAKVVNCNILFLNSILVSHHVTVAIYIDGKLHHYTDACCIDLFNYDFGKYASKTKSYPNYYINIENCFKPLYRKIF
ncbi:hypothetical protein AGMMS49982_07530 [Bacteroidia bacterium]|nr:hypothetical protein AGMMS49982_07530 [Bacteroidia bacterium]